MIIYTHSLKIFIFVYLLDLLKSGFFCSFRSQFSSCSVRYLKFYVTLDGCMKQLYVSVHLHYSDSIFKKVLGLTTFTFLITGQDSGGGAVVRLKNYPSSSLSLSWLSSLASSSSSSYFSIYSSLTSSFFSRSFL